MQRRNHFRIVHEGKKRIQSASSQRPRERKLFICDVRYTHRHTQARTHARTHARARSEEKDIILFHEMRLVHEHATESGQVL